MTSSSHSLLSGIFVTKGLTMSQKLLYTFAKQLECRLVCGSLLNAGTCLCMVYPVVGKDYARCYVHFTLESVQSKFEPFKEAFFFFLNAIGESPC